VRWQAKRDTLTQRRGISTALDNLAVLCYNTLTLNSKGSKMQTMYVLQAQGLGDNEYEFYNIGVYDSIDNLENAKQNFTREWYDDGLTDVEFNVEEFEVNT
jgi:hypothetical protein